MSFIHVNNHPHAKTLFVACCKMSNKHLIAGYHHNFFANVGPSLANKISPTQITYREFLIGHYTKCFYLNPTSPTEVANVVHSLKNSKCEGF